MPDITSPTNPLVKSLVRLRERRTRDRTGTFLIEGAIELERARLRPDLVVETVLIAADYPYVAGGDERVATVSEVVLERLAVRGTGARVVAVARQFDLSIESLPAGLDLFLVAEAIEKPGNLGTMLRTADATGAGVIVCDPLVDVFSPQVVRASLGCLFSVPIARTTIEEAIVWSEPFRTVVGTPEANRSLYDCDLSGKTAIIIGSEHDGVSARWKQSADVLCSIPMAGRADSLNAATSAAIMLYEAVRQHR